MPQPPVRYVSMEGLRVDALCAVSHRVSTRKSGGSVSNKGFSRFVLGWSIAIYFVHVQNVLERTAARAIVKVERNGRFARGYTRDAINSARANGTCPAGSVDLNRPLPSCALRRSIGAPNRPTMPETRTGATAQQAATRSSDLARVRSNATAPAEGTRAVPCSGSPRPS